MRAAEIERYTFKERLCHWLAGFSYVYCLSTGLAFYSPYLFWIAVVLGGGPASRFWHPFLGLFFSGVVMWMHVLWRGEMPLSETDRRWLDNIKFYVTNRDDRVPPQGRFNGGQKLFYWAMFYGAILLFASGAVLWFPEYVPRGLHSIRALAIVAHEGAALITIGAFIIHVYMGVFMVPGGLHAMLSGYVSRAWAEAHHRLWYDKLSKE